MFKNHRNVNNNEIWTIFLKICRISVPSILDQRMSHLNKTASVFLYYIHKSQTQDRESEWMWCASQRPTHILEELNTTWSSVLCYYEQQNKVPDWSLHPKWQSSPCPLMLMLLYDINDFQFNYKKKKTPEVLTFKTSVPCSSTPWESNRTFVLLAHAVLLQL